MNAKLTITRKDSNLTTTVIDEANLTHDIPFQMDRNIDGTSTMLYSGTIKTGGTPINLPPVIDLLTPAVMNVVQHTDVTLRAKVTDPNGNLEDVNFRQTLGVPVVITQQSQGDTYEAMFHVMDLGQYAFDVEAVDHEASKTTKQIIVNCVTVVPPTCPPGQHLENGVCVPDVTGNKIDVSKSWSNGHKRTFTGFDPDDNKVEVRANGGTACEIDGQGNCTIKGDRRRIYCYYNNYNAVMTVTLIPNFVGSGDNASLKMRSRHNEPGQTCSGGSPLDGNRFGGYGFAVKKSNWDSKREPTHNCHDESKNGSIPKALQNGKPVKLRQTVKDEGGKVHQIGEIDYMDGAGWHKVMDITDDSPKSWMVDKALYEKKSYFWIRNNGSGSITVRDLSLELL